jgi:dTDP-4-amino-4,6-dideoxygalactose transaminase
VAYAQGIRNSLVSLPIGRDSNLLTLSDHVFHLFVVRVQQRDAFQAHLENAGIGSLVHYPIPPHRQHAYKTYSELQLPLTEKIHKEVVSLPIGPTMTTEQVQKVIGVCNAYNV